jgi:ABC-2 type transport system permease protein
VSKVRGSPTEPGAGERVTFLDLAPHSGLNMALVSLEHVALLLPIVVAVFAGNAIAEEASWRTLGYLLVRPISRGRLLASKLTVVVALLLVAVLLMSLAAIVSGLVAFGWHPLDTPSGVTLSAGTALARILIATPYLAWSMAGVASVAFFLSVVADAPLPAVAAAFALVILSQVLDSLSALGAVRTVLPTHYWGAWEDLFAGSVTLDDMVAGALLQLSYAIVFLMLAWWWFRRKDILT